MPGFARRVGGHKAALCRQARICVSYTRRSPRKRFYEYIHPISGSMDFRIHDHVRTVYEYTALLYSLLNCSAPRWMRPKRCWDLRCAGRRALGDCGVWVASCWLGTRLDMTR